MTAPMRFWREASLSHRRSREGLGFTATCDVWVTANAADRAEVAGAICHEREVTRRVGRALLRGRVL